MFGIGKYFHRKNRDKRVNTTNNKHRRNWGKTLKDTNVPDVASPAVIFNNRFAPVTSIVNESFDNYPLEEETNTSTSTSSTFKARLTKIYDGKTECFDIDLDGMHLPTNVEEWCIETLLGECKCTHSEYTDSSYEEETHVVTCTNSPIILSPKRVSKKRDDDVLWKGGLKDGMKYTYVMFWY